MSVTPMPFIKARFFDNFGKPLSGGKVYTYEPRSTTPKATYTTLAADVPNTNPVILDAAGTADIYLLNSYRLIVHDANDVLIEDNDDVSNSAFLRVSDIDSATMIELGAGIAAVTNNLVSADRVQSLSLEQQAQARTNIGTHSLVSVGDIDGADFVAVVNAGVA